MVFEAQVRGVGEGGGVLPQAEAAWGGAGEAVGWGGGFVGGGGREWGAGWVKGVRGGLGEVGWAEERRVQHSAAWFVPWQ